MDESGKKKKPSVRSMWVIKSVKKPQDQEPAAGQVLSKVAEESPEPVSKEAQEEHRKSSQPAHYRTFRTMRLAPEPTESLPWESAEGFQSHQLDGGSSPSCSSGPVLEESRSKKSAASSLSSSSNTKSAGSSSAPSVISASVAKEAPEVAETLPVNSLKRFQGEQMISAAPPSGGPSSESDSGGSDSDKDDVPPAVDRRKKKKKNKLPVYAIPENLKRQIEMDTVPEVLHETLSLSNYVDYFAALLYAEDFYIEKWSKFHLYRVPLELDNKKLKKEMKKKNTSKSAWNDKKAYLSFKITSIPERRPYLLSRDYVFVRRSGKKTKFEGRVIGVVKSTHVLTEFGNDFLSHYNPSYKYDVSFSFNRTCLKRCHQAVEAALAPSFHYVLFPSCHPRTAEISPSSATFSNQRFGLHQMSAVHNIIRLKGPPPYLINGPPSVTREISLSKVGTTITEAILKIYFHMDTSRILVTSPKNHTCDTLISCLNKRIPDSDLFRANASFREVEDVPEDVLPLCSHDGDCFSSPSLAVLQEFRVIVSTFMTCFRLRDSGISPGYFSHIFMVDASSATEPDTMVALANFVTDETAVVITGSRTKYADRVRSDMARRNGLKRSYFRRLMESEPYSSNDPLCVCNLDEESEN